MGNPRFSHGHPGIKTKKRRRIEEISLGVGKTTPFQSSQMPIRNLIHGMVFQSSPETLPGDFYTLSPEMSTLSFKFFTNPPFHQSKAFFSIKTLEIPLRFLHQKHVSVSFEPLQHLSPFPM